MYGGEEMAVECGITFSLHVTVSSCQGFILVPLHHRGTNLPHRTNTIYHVHAVCVLSIICNVWVGLCVCACVFAEPIP